MAQILNLDSGWDKTDILRGNLPFISWNYIPINSPTSLVKWESAPNTGRDSVQRFTSCTIDPHVSSDRQNRTRKAKHCHNPLTNKTRVWHSYGSPSSMAFNWRWHRRGRLAIATKLTLIWDFSVEWQLPATTREYTVHTRVTVVQPSGFFMNITEVDPKEDPPTDSGTMGMYWM